MDSGGNDTLTTMVTAFANTTRPPPIDFCKKPVEKSIENIAFTCFMVFLLVASLIGNSLVIAATCLSRQLRNRVTVYFIISLAVSDMLTASLSVPFHISSKLHFNRFCHTLGSCYWWLLGDATSTMTSILNLFFIAMDRYIAINFPFKHQSIFSVRHVKMIIVGIWTFSATYALSGIFPWRSRYSIQGQTTSITTKGNFCTNSNRAFYVASFMGVYIVPLAIMTISYAMILKIALSQIHAIESTSVSLSPIRNPEATASQNNNDVINARKQRKKRIKRKELRATKSVAIVYLSFVLCWLPACIVVSILEFDRTFFPRMQKTNFSLFLFFWYGIIQILPTINTMINPLIYSFSNKQFRKGFKSVYNRMLQRIEPPKESYNSRDTRTASAISMASTVCSTGIISRKHDDNDNDNDNGDDDVGSLAKGAKIQVQANIIYNGGVQNEGYHMETSVSDDFTLVEEKNTT